MKDILTIAMPVYERSVFFREALESALIQRPAAKIIVVDNASQSFDFKRVIDEYPGHDVTYYRNPRNLGVHANWNQCIRLCSTPYVLILHDDDVLEPDYIEKFSRQFDPSVDFYWCKVSIIDKNSRVIKQDVLDYEKFRNLEAWCTHNGAYQGIIMRCTKAAELGMFNPRVLFFPDWDLYVKLLLSAKTRFLPFNGVRYRICDLSATAQLLRNHRYYVSSRNQIKRNFARTGLWAKYHSVRFTRALPAPSLKHVFGFLPQLSPRKLRYFCALIVRTETASLHNFLTKLAVRLIGWRGVRFGGNLWRMWKRLK